MGAGITNSSGIFSCSSRKDDVHIATNTTLRLMRTCHAPPSQAPLFTATSLDSETNLSRSCDSGTIILEGVSEAAARQSSEAFASIDGGEILCDKGTCFSSLTDTRESLKETNPQCLGSLRESEALGLEARFVPDSSLSFSAEQVGDVTDAETKQNISNGLK